MEILGVKYPNINAKLKGMHSKRITKTDLEDLIKQNSLKNAVLLLKIKSEIFKNSDENIDRLKLYKKVRKLEKSKIKFDLIREKILNYRLRFGGSRRAHRRCGWCRRYSCGAPFRWHRNRACPLV